MNKFPEVNDAILNNIPFIECLIRGGLFFTLVTHKFYEKRFY